MIKKFYFGENTSTIEAPIIEIGNDFKIGTNVHIRCREYVKIGNYCRFGDDVSIDAQCLEIGDHFFHYTPGLRIGGGGSHYPESSINIGDRCVFHNNYLNICKPIYIGNDVGLSPDVDMITHGFWESVLEGFPYKYASIRVGDGVIIGQRSMILPGVTIADQAVIGANSTVTKDLPTPKAIYAGNPARYIREIVEPTMDEKTQIVAEIINRYFYLCQKFKSFPLLFDYNYPLVTINGATMDLEKKTITGAEDKYSDIFRDHIRRYGIKIYSSRPFGSFNHEKIVRSHASFMPFSSSR